MFTVTVPSSVSLRILNVVSPADYRLNIYTSFIIANNGGFFSVTLP